jgi:photoactive yellow protein
MQPLVPLVTLDFTQDALLDALLPLDDAGLDALAFGVIGFDADTIVRDYNAFESRMAGLSRERVVGLPLFTGVAICMNNFMVAHCFEEAAEAGVALDATIDYVLTLRMHPQRVQLRLLARPGEARRFVLIQRKPGA